MASDAKSVLERIDAQRELLDTFERRGWEWDAGDDACLLPQLMFGLDYTTCGDGRCRECMRRAFDAFEKMVSSHD